MYDAIFFDFDGVICDSVGIKTEAFAALYERFGDDIVSSVKAYHLKYGGYSRYTKLEYFEKEILNHEGKPDEIEALAQQFSAIVVDKVISCPFIPGVIEALNGLQKDQIPMFIVSGTPEHELRYIVQERKLHHYFVEVCGSPRPKHIILEDLLSKYQFEKDRCVFLGDAITDWKAANDVGMPFFGVGFQASGLTNTVVTAPALKAYCERNK